MPEPQSTTQPSRKNVGVGGGAGVENAAKDRGRWPGESTLSPNSARMLPAHVLRAARGVTTLVWTGEFCQNTQSSTALLLATERAGNTSPEVDLSCTPGTVLKF